MATNEIPKNNLDQLIALAEDAADGATTHGPALGLVQNTAAKIRADLAVLVGPAGSPQTGKQALWLAAKQAKGDASAAKISADSNVKAFLSGAVGWLKQHLGATWSNAWVAAGWSGGSLAVPGTSDERLAQLPTLQAYFLTHPQHQLAGQDDGNGGFLPPHYTADDCQALHTAASDTRAASAASNAAAGQAKAARDAALATLRRRLSGLLAELGQLLADDDARWYAFGFSRPADPQTPQVPELVTLTAAAPQTVLVDWDDARRADRYKVWWKIAGAPGDPTLGADNVTDSDATLAGLPSGQTIEVTVTALNGAGESQPSTPATIAVP